MRSRLVNGAVYFACASHAGKSGSCHDASGDAFAPEVT